ncbi:MAG: polyprenyl synthetase family protein [Clostridiales bacterium]|nr:polyprenyl synthetase family protein [Clostridiales bacterium]
MIAGYRAAELEAALETELQNAAAIAEPLRAQLAYCLLGGGKRLRGGLCLAFCELFGGSAADALPLACALEMIHAYSLVHDDLPCMDDDATRRGKPSAHVFFGEANAILIGDALQALAFSVSAHAREEGRQAVADAALRMVAGQFAEGMHAAQDPASLREIYAQKTGALYWAAAVSGAHAARCTPEQAHIAEIYGSAFGFLFQIADDCMDRAQDEQCGKQTLLTVIGIDKLAAEARDKLEEILQLLQPYHGEAAVWLRVLIEKTVECIH